MKNFIKPCVIAGCFIFISGIAFAQTEEINESLEQVSELENQEISINNQSADLLNEDIQEGFDISEELDSMFEDSSDTEAIVTPPPAENCSENKRGIVLTGNLSTRLGGYVYFYPFDIAPGATFETTISFASRPTDYFSIHGSLLTSFPKMEIGLYELYINYALWDYAYIMAGKKEVTWGNARIFDTNILDDKNNNEKEHDPEHILYDKELDIDKSKFTVQLSVPIKMINIVGLIDYKNYITKNKSDQNSTDFLVSNLSYAAMLEANLNNFSFDVFWKKWSKNDLGWYDPVVGLNANFQLDDFHFYVQYFTHINNKIATIAFPRMKATGSVWWATKEKVNLGFILEYQFVYDCFGYGDKESPPDSSEYYKNYIAFEGVWGRINGSPFTVALKYFHDFYEGYGTIVPGVKWHDLLPNADLDIGFPIYYGTQKKIGVAIQLKLNCDF